MEEGIIHMLPTDGNGALSKCLRGYSEEGNRLCFERGQLRMETDGHPDWWQSQHLYVTVSEHIERIQVSDWFMHENKPYQLKAINPHNKLDFIVSDRGFSVDSNECRKIIATTDPTLRVFTTIGEDGTSVTLQIPKLYQLLLIDYCKKGGIGKVLVDYKDVIIDTLTNKEIHYFGFEYDDAVDGGLVVPKKISRLNIKEGNLIHLKIETKMYSKKEVEQLCRNAMFTGELLGRNPETGTPLGKGFDEISTNWIKLKL